MVVNTEHMRSLLELAGEEDSSASHLRDLAAEYEDYAARGKTMRHPRTGENVSPETLAELARVLRERADERHTRTLS
jgi:hypothetical protein